MKLATFAILAAATALTACGGGGSAGLPAPKGGVVASGPPPASLGDLAGETMPFRAARATSTGGAYDTSLEVFSIEVISDTEMELQTSVGTIALTDTGGGTFEGSLDGVDYVFQSTGLGYAYSDRWTLFETDGIAFAAATIGYFGLEAPQSKMDELHGLAVAAGYSGESQIFAIEGGVVSDDTGVANLLVDFGAGTVTGSVHSTATIDITLEDGVISGNGISGTLGLSGPDAVGYALDTSGAEGQFFGVDAIELHGTFAGSGTGPGGDVEVVGQFSTID